MARCSRAWLPLLLLACALVQSSYGSRPSTREPQMAGSHDGASKVPPSTEEGATGHRGGNADDDGGAAATSAIRWAVVVSSQQRKGSGAAVLQQALGRMLGSRLARRVLGGEAEISAAGPSCHSNNAHITCAPPAQH